jgi:hypothetical protein
MRGGGQVELKFRIRVSYRADGLRHVENRSCGPMLSHPLSHLGT